MPAALVAHLKATGAWDAGGVSRRAQARPCRRCAVVCMVGMPSTPCAYEVRCDSVPIDAVGEALALIGGTDMPVRATYRLRWYPGRGRYELDRRNVWSIRAAPAGSTDDDGQRVIVLAEHVCGAPALPVSTAAGRALAEQARQAAEDAAPWADPDAPPPF